MPLRKPHHTSENDNKKIIGDKIEINPRGLNIVWGNDGRYWSIPNVGDGPAELKQVSWLEVSGVVSVGSTEKPMKYKVEFEVKVKEGGFGWSDTDVLVMAKVGKGGKYSFKVNRLIPGQKMIIPQDPLVIDVPAPRDLHFGLYEVWSGKWKGGLEIIKAVIQPVP